MRGRRHSYFRMARHASIARFEPVAHPRLSHDVLWSARVKLQLLAKLADEDSKVLVLLNAVAAPNRVQDCAVRGRRLEVPFSPHRFCSPNRRSGWRGA